MKIKLILLALVLALLPGGAFAAGEAKAELDRLVAQIGSKLKDQKRSAEDLAPELKQFDALLAKYKDDKSDDIARIAYMKATLYLQVLKDEPKAIVLLEALKRDFPETATGKRMDAMIASIKEAPARRARQEEAQANLAVGKTFPAFSETDLAGKPLSIAGYKGKVLLVDFWATWCGPCIGELPNVKATYEKHHQAGFEIVGISLDSDKSKLTSFIAKNDMPWKQFFDGQGWQNKLAQQYGINSIPATFLLDGEGKVIAKNLRGEALEEAVAKALGKSK
ncbi:MAG: TlpA family protein disulfide reductase [Verrucomicrobia bacterium]|nr:TlpA family protein disulfide reductase [Verrucomicrobiota bacterium]